MKLNRDGFYLYRIIFSYKGFVGNCGLAYFIMPLATHRTFGFSFIFQQSPIHSSPQTLYQGVTSDSETVVITCCGYGGGGGCGCRSVPGYGGGGGGLDTPTFTVAAMMKWVRISGELGMFQTFYITVWMYIARPSRII